MFAHGLGRKVDQIGRWLLRYKQRKEVWIDVGAHLGEKTFPHAASNPELLVYAFEPNLRLAARRMGVLKNFVVLPFAVSENDGVSDFHINACDSASSLLPFHPEGLRRWISDEELEIERTVTVPTIRLDTFMREFGIARVDFLKIDAQGSDFAVLKSAGERLSDIQKICLEVTITQTPLYAGSSGKNEIIEYLERAGFTLVEQEKQSYAQEENLTFLATDSMFRSADRGNGRGKVSEVKHAGHSSHVASNPELPGLCVRAKPNRGVTLRSKPQPPKEENAVRFETMITAGKQFVKGLFGLVGLEVHFKRAAVPAPEPVPRASMAGALAQLVSLGFRPQTVIDVGVANRTEGLYQAFRDSSFLLIEPLAEFEPFLQDICKSYKAQYVLAAASEAAGTTTLHVHPDKFGSSLLREVEGLTVDGTPREVPVITIDEVCAGKNLAGPYLIKVDVQGAELKVLAGATRTLGQTEAVILEVTLFGTMIGGPQLFDIVSWMKLQGFVVFDIYGFNYRPLDGSLCQADMVFVREHGVFRQSHAFATPEQRQAQWRDADGYFASELQGAGSAPVGQEKRRHGKGEKLTSMPTDTTLRNADRVNGHETVDSVGRVIVEQRPTRR